MNNLNAESALLALVQVIHVMAPAIERGIGAEMEDPSISVASVSLDNLLSIAGFMRDSIVQGSHEAP